MWGAPAAFKRRTWGPLLWPPPSPLLLQKRTLGFSFPPGSGAPPSHSRSQISAGPHNQLPQARGVWLPNLGSPGTLARPLRAPSCCRSAAAPWWRAGLSWRQRVAPAPPTPLRQVSSQVPPQQTMDSILPRPLSRPPRDSSFTPGDC